jgi:hypothetical protein
MHEGNFSDYRANKWLDQLGTIWIALHYSDPSVSGAYASEVFGGSYTRVKTDFSSASNRVIFNEDSVKFKGLPSVQLTYIGGWDKQYNGNLEFSIPIIGGVTILAGKSYEIQASQLAISLP